MPGNSPALRVKIGEGAHAVMTRTPDGESVVFDIQILEHEVTGGFPADFTCSCAAK